MRRRDFLGVLGGTAMTWPLAARARQSATPVIGFLSIRSQGDEPQLLSAFHQGLKEVDYVVGQNVTMEYRWAEGQSGRLPVMAADLVHREVAVIAATPSAAALAAKAATATIPIVFEGGADPVKIGLVASLNRPGGNVTGVTQLNNEIAPKRLELLHELIPTATVIGLLVNPADPTIAEAYSNVVVSAAHRLGLELHVLNASSERDFDTVFANLMQLRAGGLVIGGGALFTARIEQLAALTANYAVPAIHGSREFVAAGGLVSYGASLADAYRLAGVYTGRILKGDKPAELPVQQAAKVELYINLKTAKVLGITVPLPLSGRADEIIE